MRLAGLAAALALAACAPPPAPLPGGPVPAGPAIRVSARPVPQAPPGTALPPGFAYAGGLELTSDDTARLHGLSDLEVLADGRFVAVSDEGDLVKGRVVLDAAGRLSGVADVTLAPLTNPEGQPVSGQKADSDAEGLALWPNGDLMVSFERNHRIWLYPAAGGPPRAVPKPDAPFPDNEGMEALAVDPEGGPATYLTGREDTRETWTCHLAGSCVPGLRPGKDGEGSLVAARALPGGRWAFLLRDFKPLSGVTSRILITDRRGQVLDMHTIARPATVDNFEGLAAVPRADGSVRFYIVSDDNFSPSQRTLLLAFDWRPAGAPPQGELSRRD
jgi:hypothetical protein